MISPGWLTGMGKGMGAGAERTFDTWLAMQQLKLQRQKQAQIQQALEDKRESARMKEEMEWYEQEKRRLKDLTVFHGEIKPYYKKMGWNIPDEMFSGYSEEIIRAYRKDRMADMDIGKREKTIVGTDEEEQKRIVDSHPRYIKIGDRSFRTYPPWKIETAKEWGFWDKTMMTEEETRKKHRAVKEYTDVSGITLEKKRRTKIGIEVRKTTDELANDLILDERFQRWVSENMKPDTTFKPGFRARYEKLNRDNGWNVPYKIMRKKIDELDLIPYKPEATYEEEAEIPSPVGVELRDINRVTAELRAAGATPEEIRKILKEKYGVE